MIFSDLSYVIIIINKFQVNVIPSVTSWFTLIETRFPKFQLRICIIQNLWILNFMGSNNEDIGGQQILWCPNKNFSFLIFLYHVFSAKMKYV